MAKECIMAQRVDFQVTGQVSRTVSSRTVLNVSIAACASLFLANCAQQTASPRYSSQQKREIGAFAHSKYGTASPRVYADNGAALPKGGGRQLLGNSYRVAGRSYTPHERPVGASQVGLASWYGVAFHGRKTANGEIYDRRSFSAAHPTMPLPSYARVTNMRNGASVIVRVNDRGPYHGGRIMDVSERVADTLAFKSSGTGRIRVDYLGRAGIGGSDDIRLAQTFSTTAPAVSEHIPSSFGESRATVAVAMAQPVASAPPAQPASFTPRAPVSAPKPAPVEDVADAPEAVAKAQPPVVAAAFAPVPAPAKAVTTTAQLPARAPVPPSRPLDLGTIPGANVPVKASQRTDVLSFAPRSTGATKALHNSPLAKLPAGRPAQTNDKPVTTALKD